MKSFLHPFKAPAAMASAHNFDSIPIIDLSLAATDKPRLLAQLRHALTDVGFLYVVNHGVPATAISDVVQALPRLFALPPGAKEGVALRNSPHFLGYSGDGAETTGGKTDRREQFEFATELGETWRVGSPLRDRLRGPNQVRNALQTNQRPTPPRSGFARWPKADK